MKKITFSIIAIVLFSAAIAQKLDRSIKPKPGPAPEIKLGNTESFTLPNGMKVFVVENHKLPTISCSIQFDVNPELQGNMAGYREMMSELLTAGTTTRTKEKLNSEIDQMGASINVSDEGMFGRGMKKYMGKIFELMADMAMNAVITNEELEKAKKKMLSGIQTQKNQPDAMVNNVSAVVNFGDKHPYGEIATEETVKKITVDRCIQYYKTYFRPNVAYVAIVGDITMAEVKPLIESYFGKWERANVPVATYALRAPINASRTTKVDFAPRTGAVQSVVNVTYPIDLKPGTPDVIKAKVANTILGGGSFGRLFLHIREAHGWGYGSYSTIQEDDKVGSFSAELKVQNNVSDSALEVLLDEMRIMRSQPVPDTTLQNCITYMSGNFAIGLEDPKRVAQFAINIERYNMPKDYYQNYLKNLSAVTAADVMEVSKKYILPDQANIVVAGNKDAVASKLTKYSADGKIDYFDWAGKPLVISEATAAPSGITADEVYKKYLTAMGGEKAFNSIKDLKLVMKTSFQGRDMSVTIIKKSPNKSLQSMDMEMGAQKMNVGKSVFDGTKGYQAGGGQRKDMTEEEINEAKEEADIAADLHPEKYGIKRTLAGMEQVNGINAYKINVVDGRGKKSTEYYDAASSMLIKKIKGEGDEMETTDYADYKEVTGTNGFKVAYTITQVGGGLPVPLTFKVQTAEANTNIPDSEFN
ncbi:MAG: processing peptidase [Flavipsychrobacter sp.]|jgi:predicted Zn-dependent peptidase|nr:processing peptidase [Flavipsychrobacter sp.]